MSGTSLDGVDAAVIETDGERIAALRADRLSPLFATTSGRLLRQALAEAAT